MICSAEDAIPCRGAHFVVQLLGRFRGVSPAPDLVLSAGWGVTTKLALSLADATFEYSEEKDAVRRALEWVC